MNLPLAESKPQLYYPNKMVRIVLLAMEEVLGRNERAVFDGCSRNCASRWNRRGRVVRS